MNAEPAHAAERPPWREQAACLGEDPRLFTDPRPDTDDTRHALGVCHRCPVQTACLNEALALPANADIGIWGATTEEARLAMRRQTAALERVTAPAPGLFRTLEGDLTDITGRGLIIELPTPPRLLLLVDHQPQLRTDNLDQASHQLIATLPELQSDALAPFALTASGELTEPSGRVLITRLPVAPHLLLVLDGRPHARADRLEHARHRALSWLATHRHTEPTVPPQRGPVVRVGDNDHRRRPNKRATEGVSLLPIARR
ncbi:MAG: WhiB family transcriptional regulator [Actinobacteria bacterium]|jgi:WhiB family redox-sensing transcriptional regulator|nr:WhiB family transcriptional regulator [Actinomycetota bacterium]